MSNRPNRARGTTATRSGTSADQRRVYFISGAVVLLVVVVGLIVAFAGGADEETRDAEDAPHYGPVAIEGTALAELPSGGDDPAVGQPAPVVEGTTPDGEPISIGGSGGEPTLVAFLAHWCPHCQVEVPVIVDLMTGGHLDGVRTVAVLTGTDPNRPNFPPVAWMEREDWAGEMLLDDDTSAAAQSYGLSAFPFLVVLDGDGNVVARASGEVPANDIVALVDEAR